MYISLSFLDEPSLEEWKKDLHLNDELLGKLYTAVNEFLIRKDSHQFTNTDGTFQVNVPNGSTSSSEPLPSSDHFQDGKISVKKKRSVCNGFRDSLSCFRTYLALWMLQRQGLKDPISLRNIGKRSRAYSFRSVGKRGRGSSFRSIGKRVSYDTLEQNDQEPDSNDQSDMEKRDIRFPRSYFRSIGKRYALEGLHDDSFDRDTRMSFRSVGKRNPYFNRDQRMAFRSIGKRERFDRDSRMSFRSVGKRDDQFERDDRMAFRSIGKRDPGYETDDRIEFQNNGNSDSSFDRENRMSFRTIGKRDPFTVRNTRMSFRSVGKRDDADEIQKRPFSGSSFRSIGKRSVNSETDRSI